MLWRNTFCSILTEQKAPADRVIRVLTPKCLYRDENRSLWDAGENISGVVRIHAPGASGEVIRLRFSERIGERELDFASACGAEYTCSSGRKQVMEDTFICGSGESVFEPKFVWHAFRYFEMTGPGYNPEVLVIHSNTPVNSSFFCDSEGWNHLYDAFLRTQLGNMHGGFPSDCPHRERLGYTGDGQAASASAMLLDSREFYRKWIQHIVIAPATPHGMNHAQGSIDTPWGTIASAWKRDGGQITFEVDIPVEASAVFYYKEHHQKLKPGMQRFVVADESLHF